MALSPTRVLIASGQVEDVGLRLKGFWGAHQSMSSPGPFEQLCNPSDCAGLGQGDLVRPSGHGWRGELEPVALLEADWADRVRAGHRSQRAESATRVAVAHLFIPSVEPADVSGISPPRIRGRSAAGP